MLLIVNLMAFLAVYLLQVKQAIKFLVWGSIGFSILTLECIGILFYVEYQSLISNRCLFGENRHGCGGTMSDIFFWLAIFFWVAGIVYMAWMAINFNQINLGIGIMHAALPITKKIREMKYIPFYPTISILILAVGFISIVFESFSI